MDSEWVMSELGYETTESEVTNRLSRLDNNPDYHTIVAEIDGKVVGLLGLHIGLAYEFSSCLCMRDRIFKIGAKTLL